MSLLEGGGLEGSGLEGSGAEGSTERDERTHLPIVSTS
jgi:hypothetical protein